MYLLDTNTVIDFFHGHPKVRENLFANPPREICIATICVYEIEVGIAKSVQANKRRQQFNSFLEIIAVIPFDRAAADAAAGIRAELEKSGRPIGPLDNLIAGIAQAQHATLVTHNVREFSRISAIQVADWRA